MVICSVDWLLSSMQILTHAVFCLCAHHDVYMPVCSAGYAAVLRLRSIPAVNRAFLDAFGPLLRPHEVAGAWPGAFWLLLAALFLYTHVDAELASLAIVFVSVGDPIAALAGTLFGKGTRVLPGGKSLVGTVSCFAACLAAALALESVSTLHVSSLDRPLLFGLIATQWQLMSWAGAAAAAVAEALPFAIDDNLVVPVTAALLMQGIAVATLPA